MPVNHRGDEPCIRGEIKRFERCENNGGYTRPARALLRDFRNRQRKLAVQFQDAGLNGGPVFLEDTES